MSRPALEVEHLNKFFGALKATDDLSLTVEEGELHAIIGPNGAGKSTLISQLSGQLRPTSGHIRFFGEDLSRRSMACRVQRGIVRSFQITSLCREFSTLTNVALAVQARVGHSFHFFRNAEDDPLFTAPAQDALERVGLGHRAHVAAGHLAHGEQRQLELAIALAAQPRLLLLDEPMAGMGLDESMKVVELLRSLKGHYTIVLVEHDMDAVFALADRISVLVYGHCIASGAPEQIRKDPAVQDAYLGEDEANARSA
jgi:branched-chain amino acid transport system ATP-binding protein